MTTDGGQWPAIPSEPRGAPHLWTQILGEHRLAHTPRANHSRHATLHVTPAGLMTGPVQEPGGCLAPTLDLVGHRLVVEGTGGAADRLRPGRDERGRASSIARGRRGARSRSTAGPTSRPTRPRSRWIARLRPHGADAVARFHGARLRIVPALERFRTGFPGEVSPVHLFWGSFDHAVTGFSGRAAPPHPGGLPDLPDAATREAHGHEVSSAGFWPGHGGAGEAMLRACAHPTPEGLAERPVASEAARRDADLDELLLPYEAVRTADDPADASMRFPRSTHEAAAGTARRSTATSRSRAPWPPSGAPRPATWGTRCQR